MTIVPGPSASVRADVLVRAHFDCARAHSGPPHAARFSSVRPAASAFLSRWRVLPFLLAAGVLGAHPADSPAGASGGNLADLSLEELMGVRVESVSGASKYQQKVTRAPAAVTIVTGEEIAVFGHRTLAEVVRSVRGMYVTNDTNYSYFGTRGFLRPGDYNTRMLVLVDGHRINDNVYDSGLFDREHPMDVEDIERVEVIRGPSSSVYGSNSFFGVLNIVTRRGRQVDGAEVSGEIGSLGTSRGRLAVGRLLKNELELYFSASAYQSEGRAAIYFPEFDERISDNPRARDQGIARNADAEDAYKLFGSVKYRELTFSAAYARRDKVVPAASFGTVFNTDRELTRDRRGYVDMRYEHEVSPQLRLMARGGYDSYSYDGQYPYEAAGLGGRASTFINRDHALGEWLTAEAQVTVAEAGKYTVVSGAEFRENLQQKQVNYDEVSPRVYYYATQHGSRTFGAFLQGEVQLRRETLLNAGIRYDHYFRSIGGTLNPRVGFIHDLAPKTTIKALYGQAFRAPNDYEVTYNAPVSDRRLSPEKVRTYELAVEQYFSGDRRASLSLYRYDVRGLISQHEFVAGEAEEGDFYFANVDRYTGQGVELEFEGRYARNIRLRVSHALQRAEDRATRQELTNSPRHLSKLNLGFPLHGDRVTSGLELQYMSSAKTMTGNRAEGFLVGSLTIQAHRLPGGAELSATIYNLFDTRYGYLGAEDHAQDILAQEGRSFRVKLLWRF